MWFSVTGGWQEKSRRCPCWPVKYRNLYRKSRVFNLIVFE